MAYMKPKNRPENQKSAKLCYKSAFALYIVCTRDESRRKSKMKNRQSFSASNPFDAATAPMSTLSASGDSNSSNISHKKEKTSKSFVLIIILTSSNSKHQQIDSVNSIFLTGMTLCSFLCFQLWHDMNVTILFFDVHMYRKLLL
eukprot:UN27848